MNISKSQRSVYNMSIESDRLRFDQLVCDNPSIEVIDEYSSQVNEYNEIIKFTQGEKLDPLINLGCYVFYPWLNKVVRVLSEDQFIEVRTSRNKNKIEKEEQEILSKKTILIVGLSVGQSSAITIALERIAGNFIVSDFDTLELSNMNRIRTGIVNLGLKKTEIVSREINEIDPYLNVKSYDEGISELNIDVIFKEHDIDLIIDECDDLQTKIMLREKAKENEIPLVMEMSDRGVIDIERYDLNKDLSFFTGALDEKDLSQIKNLSKKELLEYLFLIHPAESLSRRMLDSVPEIGISIPTWPQLASSIALGGGIMAIVVRNIFLNTFRKSGRYFVDIDEIIINK